MSDLIKTCRVKSNLTQENMACLLGISLRHYQNIESGKAIPNIFIGLELANILKVNPYTLWVKN